MMANWSPISGVMSQYDKSTAAGGGPASGYYLKFYDTSNIAINMASASDGTGSLAKAQLDSSGYPINGSSDRFIPFIDQDYRPALYTNSADADSDTIANADWFPGTTLRALTGSSEIFLAKTLADAIADTGAVAGKNPVIISDRGDGVFDYVLSSTVTENTYNIIQCTGVGTLSLVLRIGKSIYMPALGTTQGAIQAAYDTGVKNIDYDGNQTYTLDATTNVPSNTISRFNGCTFETDLNGHSFASIGTSGARLSDIYMVGPCTATATTIGTGGQQFWHTEFCDRVWAHTNIRMIDYGGTGVKFAQGTSSAGVFRCSTKNIGTISLYAEGQGDNGASALATNIFFHENEVNDFTYGIELKQVRGFSIKDNILTDAIVASTKYGILVTRDYNQGGYTDQYTPQNGVISGNIVINPSSAGWGINVTASTDVIVSGNEVINAGKYGITVSGSHHIVNNNIVNGGATTGISVSYGDPTPGTNGAASTYDKGYFTVDGNSVKAHVGLSYNFTDCQDSTISDNKAIGQTGGTNVFAFDGCAGSDITGNGSKGGAQSGPAFRIEDNSNGNLLWVDNTDDAGDGSISLSVPSSFSGYYTKRNDGYSYEKVSFLRTTDATSTVIDSLTLDTNKAWNLEQHTVVRNSSYRRDTKSASLIYRAASAAVLGGTSSLWDFNNGTSVSVGVSSNDGRITVTGVAGNTLDWTTISKWTRAKG